MDKRGKFITFEGVEGSGKTTQATLFSGYLRNKGLGVVETRDPGGTALGEEIRKLLLSPFNSVPTPIAELLLFLAARAQLVTEIIVPAVEAGRWVVCDRFSDSTLAYQGYARAIGAKVVRTLNETATGGLNPDMTVLLDIDVEKGIKRALAEKGEFSKDKEGDRMEKEAEEFHRLVRKGYLELAEQEPERIKLISASGTIQEVQDIVTSLVEPFLVTAK